MKIILQSIYISYYSNTLNYLNILHCNKKYKIYFHSFLFYLEMKIINQNILYFIACYLSDQEIKNGI